jgi:hypothetical protein
MRQPGFAMRRTVSLGDHVEADAEAEPYRVR